MRSNSMQGRTVLQGKGILCPREQQTTNQAFEIEKTQTRKIEEEKTEKKEKTQQKGF